MRLVVRHAGSLKPVQLGQKSSRRNQQVTQRTDLCQSEPETLMAPSFIQSDASSIQTPVESGGASEEELEEIRDVIADAPLIQSSNSLASAPTVEAPVEANFPPGVARTILARLRELGIPPTTSVRALVTQTPETQLERNVLALEEEAATKGLKLPIAAFKYFVTHNCQPRLSSRQAWWNSAAVALGREKRDLLIQAVFEYAGEEVVLFTSGQRLPLAQAQLMSWSAIADLGDMT